MLHLLEKVNDRNTEYNIGKMELENINDFELKDIIEL